MTTTTTMRIRSDCNAVRTSWTRKDKNGIVGTRIFSRLHHDVVVVQDVGDGVGAFNAFKRSLCSMVFKVSCHFLWFGRCID
jgi:hypothetical protein